MPNVRNVFVGMSAYAENNANFTGRFQFEWLIAENQFERRITGIDEAFYKYLSTLNYCRCCKTFEIFLPSLTTQMSSKH